MRALALALLALLAPACTSPAPAPSAGGVHHLVLLWLRDPADEAGRERLAETARSFLAIPGVLAVEVGRALPSDREVVDASFHLAILMRFADPAALAAYEEHPDHRRAVEQVLLPLVERVLVYDFSG
jgi:hypothetical protein